MRKRRAHPNAGSSCEIVHKKTRRKYLREQWDRAEAQGEQRGAAALVAAVLDVLAARAIAVSDDQRATVLACKDLDELRGWVVRAATVEHADDPAAGL